MNYTNYAILNYLFGHPIAMLAVVVMGVAAVILWIGAPVTWRNGEGSSRDDGEATAGALRGFFNLFRL